MHRRGFTLLEVLLAVVVLGTVLLGTARFTATFLRSVTTSTISTVATEVAAERIALVTSDPSYATLAATWSGSTTGFPGYPRMRRETVVQRITGTNPRRDYTVVTVSVTEPTLMAPIRLSTTVAQE